MTDNIQTRVVITLNFEAIHNWPAASTYPNPDIHFLSNPHRHIFYVTMKWNVNSLDREIEFIEKKHEVQSWIKEHFSINIEQKSCEMIAKELLDQFNPAFVSVYEDNENGAEVCRKL